MNQKRDERKNSATLLVRRQTGVNGETHEKKKR